MTHWLSRLFQKPPRARKTEIHRMDTLSTDSNLAKERAERDARLKRLEAEEAAAAWQARVEAAVAAVEMPSYPYRILRRAGQDYWTVEKAKVYRPDRPPIQHRERPSESGLLQNYQPWANPIPADYRADRTPKVKLYWEDIGPDRPVGEGDRIRYEKAPFFTYSEAKKWLLSYLSPAPEETYFDAAGKEGAPK